MATDPRDKEVRKAHAAVLSTKGTHYECRRCEFIGTLKEACAHVARQQFTI